MTAEGSDTDDAPRTDDAVDASGAHPTTVGPVAPAPAKHGPTRRTVLRGIGVGAAVAVAGLAWRGQHQQVFTPGSGPQYTAWSGLDRTDGTDAMAAAAVLAASAHNMQNWHLRIRGTRIDLLDDPTRSIGVVDPYRREAQLGLGCALAHLELAGPPHGYSVRTELAPADGGADCVASLTVSRAARTEPDALYLAIPRRHSDRGPYPDEIPADALLDRVAAQATDGSAGARIVWVTGAQERGAVGQLLVDAAQALVDDPAMSIDNAAWMRYDAAQIHRRKDGLTLDAQALPTFIEVAGKLLPPVSRTSGDSTWVTMTRDVHTATARAYGLVLADRGSLTDRLRAGRTLERLHLGLTHEGWAMQHLNQAVEMAEREQSTGNGTEFGDRLTAVADGAEVIAVVRTGRPSARAVRSPRRPFTDVLV